MIDASARPIWWHAHSGPPYVCRGGAGWRGKSVTEDLAAVHRDDGLGVVVVASLDPPEHCPYAIPGWAMLRGSVEA